jgi:hypothetical protein
MAAIKVDVIGSELVAWGASRIENTLQSHGWRLHSDAYFTSWRKASYSANDVQLVLTACQNLGIEMIKGVLVDFMQEDALAEPVASKMEPAA